MEPIEFYKPLEKEFTIYSKSGCPNCKKVKELLESSDSNFTIVDCDEYLVNSKPEFLHFIALLSNQYWTTFPIVFEGSQFIGGFIDTRVYLSNKS
jgi:glutaredoxin